MNAIVFIIFTLRPYYSSVCMLQVESLLRFFDNNLLNLFEFWAERKNNQVVYELVALTYSFSNLNWHTALVHVFASVNSTMTRKAWVFAPWCRQRRHVAAASSAVCKSQAWGASGGGDDWCIAPSVGITCDGNHYSVRLWSHHTNTHSRTFIDSYACMRIRTRARITCIRPYVHT